MLITAYRNRMRLAGYRPRTIAARVTCLRAYEKSLVGHQATVQTATRLHVEAFLARDLAAESRRAYRGHLQGLYRWAVEEDLVASDPTAKLPAIRVPRAVPRPISTHDLQKAVAQADPRMRAWLLLMALAGLRCLEVAALRPEDVSATEVGALLHLRECKGGGTAVVPAHRAVLAALVQLPARDGRWWTCEAHTVSVQTNAYLRAQGIRATAHQLRHRAGTDWYAASGHDLLTTAALLRHASAQTTQRYVQLDPLRAGAVVDAVPAPHLRVV